MAKKNKNKIKARFLGANAYQVTGSMVLVEYKDLKILVECGLSQSNKPIQDFKDNSRRFKFKASEIDYIFVGHPHIDHSGRLPKLFKEGANCPVITSYDAVDIFKPLLYDSAFIMSRDVELVKRRTGKNVDPIYSDEDVANTLLAMKGYDYNVIHKLDDRVSFKLVPSGHIIGACQIILYITEDTGRTTKLLYTSDLGNISSKQYFVKEFEPVHKANYVIGEATYGNPERRITTRQDRKKDLEKLKATIQQTCVENRGKVIIPVFSLQRAQTMLRVIYELFGDDSTFKIPVVLDTPLGVEMTKLFHQNLEGIQHDELTEAVMWKNVRMISDHKESKACCGSKTPMVVLSSSGMATAGRVRFYLENTLKDHKNTIVFCGFSVEGSLSWKIKNLKSQKTINIGGKPISNKANVLNLISFSGHMQFDDLVKYYSQIHCERLYLVHGDMEAKLKLKYALEERYREQGKTTKVVCVNKGTVATF